MFAPQGIKNEEKSKDFDMVLNLIRGGVRGIIVPLYLYPWDSTTNTWNTTFLNYLKNLRSYKIPSITVINPSNGAGNVQDLVYVRAIRMLKSAFSFVAGYVPTNYGNSPNVVQEVIKWKKMYPDIDGIFLDEVPTQNIYVNQYKQYDSTIKALGFKFTILNPGTFVDKDFYLKNVGDIIIEWENSTVPTEADYEKDWEYSPRELPSFKRGAIIHSYTLSNTSQFNQMVGLLAKYNGWVYVAPDNTFSNPQYVDVLSELLAKGIFKFVVI